MFSFQTLHVLCELRKFLPKYRIMWPMPSYLFFLEFSNSFFLTVRYLYLSPPQGVTPSEFCEDVWLFDADKSRMIALPYGEKKLWQYVKPFSSDTGTLRTDERTDRRTDRIALSISRVSVLTRDKNYTTWCLLITLANVDRFLKFFHKKNFLTNQLVKEFWKSVNICFWDTEYTFQ